MIACKGTICSKRNGQGIWRAGYPLATTLCQQKEAMVFLWGGGEKSLTNIVPSIIIIETKISRTNFTHS